jgi:hypothetical protein
MLVPAFAKPHALTNAMADKRRIIFLMDALI